MFLLIYVITAQREKLYIIKFNYGSNIACLRTALLGLGFSITCGLVEKGTRYTSRLSGIWWAQISTIVTNGTHMSPVSRTSSTFLNPWPKSCKYTHTQHVSHFNRQLNTRWERGWDREIVKKKDKKLFIQVTLLRLVSWQTAIWKTRVT